MAVKKSKRTQANSKGRIVKHPRIPKRTKVEVATTNKCKDCGCHIAVGEHYCGECLCEDDSGY